VFRRRSAAPNLALAADAVRGGRSKAPQSFAPA
jgi:hypothetical protein